MTLQDSLTALNNSLTSAFSTFGKFVPNLFAFIIVLFVGFIAASLLKAVWVEISKALNLEKNLSGATFYQRVVKADASLNLTDSLAFIIFWLTNLVFLFASLELLGVSGTTQVAESFLGFLPFLIKALLYIVTGSLVAWLFNRLINTWGTLTGLPAFSYVGKLSAAIVVVFSLLQAAKTLSVGQDVINAIGLALLSSLALAVALNAKEIFSNLISAVKKVIK